MKVVGKHDAFFCDAYALGEQQWGLSIKRNNDLYEEC